MSRDESAMGPRLWNGNNPYSVKDLPSLFMEVHQGWIQETWNTLSPDGKEWVFSVWKAPDGIAFSMQYCNNVGYGATLKNSFKIDALEYIKMLNRVLQLYKYMTTEDVRRYIGLWMFRCCKELMNKKNSQ